MSAWWSSFLDWATAPVLVRRVRPIPPFVAFPFLFALLLWRALAALPNPQFWAEDGTVFFADAYNRGLGTLLEPYMGYLHLLPRIVGLAAAQAPTDAEHLMLYSALAIQAGVASFLLSDRLRMNPNLRLLLACWIVAYPNAWEIPMHVAYVQWFLAVWASAWLVARDPASGSGKALEILWIPLVALTGPFMVVLLPMLVVRGLRSRSAFRFGATALAAVLSLAHLAVMAQAPPRPAADSSRRLDMVLSMLTEQVGTGAVEGMGSVEQRLLATPRMWLEVLVVLAILFYGAWRGPRLLRVLAYIGGVAFAAALVTGDWHQMTYPGIGTRYFFLLGLGFLGCLGALAMARHPRAASILFLILGALSLRGIIENWTLPVQDQTYFELAAPAIERGEPVLVPIQPENWYIELEGKP